MERYIPLEKQSKKKQKQAYAKRRGTWGGLNPVTRKPTRPNAYNRPKSKRRSRQDCDADF